LVFQPKGINKMRCTKCGYISFDQSDSCSKCDTDLTIISSQLNGTALKVETPYFLDPALEESRGDTESDPDLPPELPSSDTDITLDQEGEEFEVQISEDELDTEIEFIGAEEDSLTELTITDETEEIDLDFEPEEQVTELVEPEDEQLDLADLNYLPEEDSGTIEFSLSDPESTEEDDPQNQSMELDSLVHNQGLEPDIDETETIEPQVELETVDLEEEQTSSIPLNSIASQIDMTGLDIDNADDFEITPGQAAAPYTAADSEIEPDELDIALDEINLKQQPSQQQEVELNTAADQLAMNLEEIDLSDLAPQQETTVVSTTGVEAKKDNDDMEIKLTELDFSLSDSTEPLTPDQETGSMGDEDTETSDNNSTSLSDMLGDINIKETEIETTEIEKEIEITTLSLESIDGKSETPEDTEQVASNIKDLGLTLESDN
jgi:hypothetical protein